MANEQTVKIPISLEVIDSSVQNIKDILGKMKPDSAGFKQLSKIMDDLVKSSGKIQASFERGFSSNSEIKAAEKEIRNVEAAMESLNKLSGSITFKDLKLDDSQQKTFTKLEQDLNIAKQHYNDLLKSFGNKENSALIQLVDKDLALRSFDEIQAALTGKIHEMESSAQGLQTIFTKMSEQVNKITEAQKNGSYKQGDAIKNIIGEDAYKDYFLDTKRGLAFNGTKFTGKGGAKSAFIEYLKQSFTLTDADLVDIRNATSAKDLERIFSDESIISGLTNKISTNLGNGNNLVTQLKNLLNQVNSVGSEMNGAGTALDAFKAQIMSSANVSPELAQALTLVISKMQELRGQAGAAGTQLQQFNKQAQMIDQIKGMADRFLGLYQIIGFIRKGFHEMTTTIKELDTVMNGISIVTNMSTSDLWNQVDVYSKMAQQYGTSIKGAYEVSRIYYQQGLETKDVMTLTEETLKLSKISGLDYATTTDYMTTALRGFKMEMTDASKVVDVYSNLAANTAVSQQELAEAMTRTASSMESVGATFEETSAMIATMVAVTRESASNIGSAMKSIASRYGELTKDPTKLIDEEGEQMDFNKVDTALRSIGISMHTADGQFRDFTEVILELADAWKTLDSTQQRYVATQFAGNRQQSRFLALVSNGDLLRQNLQVAENSEDVGTTQALKALDSIETKITQVTNAWQQFYLNIGLEDAWKGALTGITNILNTLNEMPKIFGKFPIVAIGVVTNAISLIRNLINSAIASVTQTIVSAASSTGTNAGKALGTNMKVTVLQDLKEIKDNIDLIGQGIGSPGLLGKGNWEGKAGQSLGRVASIMGTIASAASLFAISMNDGSRAAELTSGWITNISGLLQLAAGVLMTIFGSKSAGIMMIVSSISSIISGIALIDETSEEKIDRLTKEAETLSNTAKQLKTDEKNAEQLIKKYEELKIKQYESEEAAEEFKQVQNDLAAAFPQLVLSIDEAGNAIIDASQTEYILAEARRATADATLEAAKKERDAAKAKADEAANNVANKRNEIVTEAFFAQEYGRMSVQDTIWNKFSREASDDDYFGLISILSEKNANFKSQGYFDNATDEDMVATLLGQPQGSTKEVLRKAYNDIQEELDPATEKFLKLYFDETSLSIYDATNQLVSTLENPKATEDEIISSINTFQQAYNKYVEVFGDDIAPRYKNLADKLAEYTTEIQNGLRLEDLFKTQNQQVLITEMNKARSEANIDNEKYSGFITLAQTSVLQGYDESQTPEDYFKKSNFIQNINDMINAASSVLVDDKLEQFNKLITDTKHYGSAKELKEALGLDEDFTALDEDLQTYYDAVSKQYKTNSEKAIQAAVEKRADNRTGFFDAFKLIVSDNNKQVNSYLEQSAISGLLEYEKLIAKTATNKQLKVAGVRAYGLVREIDQIDSFLADQIISNGFTTVEGFQESINLLEQSEGYKTNDAAQRMVTRMKEMQKLLSENLGLALQTQIDGIQKTIDEASGYVSKAFSGVSSIEDAQKMLAYFNQYRGGEDKLTFDNLNYFNGKFTLKDAYNNTEILKQELKTELEETQSVLDDVTKEFGADGSSIDSYIEALITNVDADKQLLKTVLTTDYDKYFDESGAFIKGENKEQELIAAVKARFTELQVTEKQLAESVNLVDIIFGDSLTNNNSLLAQTQDAQRKISKEFTFGEVVKNFNSISTDAIANFASAFVKDFNEVIQSFTQQMDGTWRYNGSLTDFISEYGEEGYAIAQKALGDELVNQQNIVKDFYSSMIDSITKGKQRIAITNDNRDTLVELALKYGNLVSEEQGAFFVEITEETAEDIIAGIQVDENLSSYEKGDYINKIRSNLKDQSLSKLLSNMVSNYEDIPYTVLNSIADQLGITPEQLYGENGPVKFNASTQKYSTSLQDLYYFVNQLMTEGIEGTILDAGSAAEIFGQIEKALGNLTPQNLFTNLISNNGSITNDIITTFVEGWNKIAAEGSQIAVEDISKFVTDGEIDTSTILALMQTFGVEIDEAIAKQLKSKFDSYVSEINGLAGEITNGLTDTGKINTIIKQINRNYNRSDGQALEFDDLFDYNKELNAYVYTSTGIITRIRSLKQGLNDIAQGTKEYDEALVNYELAEKEFAIQLHELGNNIDLISIATAAEGSLEQSKAIEKVRTQLQTYNEVAAEIGGTLVGQFNFDQLVQGGLAAVQLMQGIYETLGRELSTEDIKNIYQGQINNFSNAIENLEKATKGEIIDKTTYELGQMAGLLEGTEIGDTGLYKITGMAYENLAQAYRNLYSSLQASGEATTAQLNEVALKIWSTIGSKEQKVIDTLGSATNLSFEEFGTMLSEFGIELTEDTIEEYAQYLTAIGGNKLIISDFKGLMNQLGFDSSSQEYQKAYSEYISSLISQSNEIKDRIENAISNLQNAKVGDQINVYDLVGDLEMQNEELGFSIKDGILNITKGMAIPTIISMVLDSAANNLTTDQKYLVERVANESSIQQLWLDIGKTYDSVSFDLIQKLASAMGATIESVETTFFTKNADGSYAGKYNIQDIFTQYGVDLTSPAAQEVLRVQVQNYRDAIDSTIQSALSSITNGTQRITKTAANTDILNELNNSFVTVDDLTGEYLITITKNNIKDFEDFIKNQSNLTSRQKSNYIAQARQSLASQDISNVLSNITSNITNVSYQTATDLALQIEQLFPSIGTQTPELLMTQGLFSDFDENTQSFVLNVAYFTEWINQYADSLGISDAVLKNLNQQLNQYSGFEVVKSFITSSNNITDEMVINLSKITGLMEDEIREKYLKKEAGQWKMSSRVALALAQQYDNANNDLLDLWKNTYLDNIFNGISNIGSNIFSTSFNYNELKQLTQDIQDWTGQEFNVEDLASYNSELQTFILTQQGIFAKIGLVRQQLEAAGMDSQIVNDQINSMIDQFGKSIDFSAAFEFKTQDISSRNRNIAQLQANAQAYYEMLSAASRDQDAEYFKEHYHYMLQGGQIGLQSALAIYTMLGQEMSADTAQSILQAPAQKLLESRRVLDNNVGDVISSEAAALGVAAGYLEVTDTGYGLAQIIKINKDKLDAALWAYYDGIRQQMAAGVEGLTEESNNTIISIWEQRAAKDTTAINAFDKAMGMTYREFGEMAIDAGYELTVGLLDQFIGEGILEDIGNGKVRIANFDKFAEKMGYDDTSSKAYKEARSKYRDSVIELNNQTRDDVLKNIDSVKDAKIGDQINLSAIVDIIGQNFTEALASGLQNYGATLEDGILTIGENADISMIAMSIAQMAQAKGAILEDDLMQLGEALEEAINNYIDTITKALSGGVKGSGQKEIINFARTLGVTLQANDFIGAADGMKLTTDAALKLYVAMSQLENIDTSSMFEALQESLFKRDSIDTMDDIMAKIASLQKEISANEAAHAGHVEEVNAALQRELDLYSKIAQHEMMNPENYNFMNKSLPSEYQGALNYWESTATMMQTMVESGKSGYMGVQDFYNIAQQMEHLSQLSGKTMQMMGVDIGEGAMTAAQLIEKGMANLEYVEGKGMQINLSGLADIGLNLSSSAEDMAAGVQDGIHAMAKSQVEMLDGLIGLLEAIVAMEAISDVDSNGDHTLDVREIFKVEGTGELSENMTKFASELLTDIEKSEELKKEFEALKIGEHSLYEIIKDAADGTKDIKMATSEYVDLWNALYKTALDQDFDASDLSSIVQQLYKNGLKDVEYTLKDGRKLVIKKGKILVQNEKGEWIVDGNTYPSADDAISALVEKETKEAIDAFNKGKDEKGVTIDNNKKAVIIIGGQKFEYKIDHTDNGYFTVDGVNGSYKTPAEALRAAFLASNGNKEWKEGIKFSDMTSDQLDIILGFRVLPQIDSAMQLNAEQSARLREALEKYKIETVDDLKANAETLSLELGFEINPEIFSSDAALQNFKGTVHIVDVDLTSIEAVHIAGIVDIVAVEGLEEKVKQSVVLALSNGETATGMVERMRGQGYTDKQVLEAVETYGKAAGGLSETEMRALGSLEGTPVTFGAKGAFDGTTAEAWYASKHINTSVADLGLKGTYNSSEKRWEFYQHDIDAAIAKNQDYFNSIGVNKGNFLTYYDHVRGTELETQLIEGIKKGIAPESIWKDIQDNINQQKNQNKDNKKEDKSQTNDSQIKDYDYGARGRELAKQEELNTQKETAATEAMNNINNISKTVEDSVKQQYEAVKKDIGDNFQNYDQSKDSGYQKFLKSTAWDTATQTGQADAITQQAKEMAKALATNQKEQAYLEAQYTRELGQAWYQQYQQALNGPTKQSDVEIMSNAANEFTTATNTFASAVGDFAALITDKVENKNEQPEDQQFVPMEQVPVFTQSTSSDGKKSATQVLEDIKDIQSEISVKEGQRITLEDNQVRQQKKLTELQAQRQAEIGIHTDQKQVTSSVDGEIAIAENNLKNTTAGLASIDNQLSSLHTNLDNATASLASMPVADVLSALTTAITGLSGPASSAASAISSTAESLSRLRSRDVTVRVYAEVETQTKGTGNATISVETSGANNAKGNVALAGGTKTLMGELGPELVVSNGQYFIAGENGAEFVDLADDAIVFNHLQTQRLLKNGFSGRGKALTNERNATSLATGNVQGPAMASASAVLAQLRQIRAQWESLANLSLVDLAKKGGGGGGGGSDKVIPGFMREVERWYNWLQKIADLEKQITYQEKLRSKIQSDMVSNGKAYYASQRKTYEDARASALTSESLFLQQKEYFNIRRQMLSDAPISSIYTFDETGQAHYKDEEAREWMEKLFTSDKYGQMALTPKQQYQMILSRNPALADYMKYDKEGKEIKKSDYKQVDEYYLAMVEAFSDRLTSEQEEMQELFDSWNEQQQAVLEQMQTMNEQLQAMKDNQKEVENAVLDAIVESREREIQAMEDTRDAIEQTNEDFIDGLNKSLDKERQMYEGTQKDQELERNRRQLAILKRSGASASQISQLQEKVDQQARDQYFEKQQEQIDAVKEASDLQLEKMDAQIELAQEQLEYEKANGLLWGQVYQVMSGSASEIAQFIKGNTKEWWTNSPLMSSEEAGKIIFQAEQWKAFSEDTDMQNASLGKINQNLDIFMGAMKEIYGKDVKWDEIEKTAQTKYEALFGPNNDDPGSTAWQAYQSATELATTKPKITEAPSTNVNIDNDDSDRNGKEKAWSYNKEYHFHKNWRNGTWTMADKAKHTWRAVGVGRDGKLKEVCNICKAVRYSEPTAQQKANANLTSVLDRTSVNKPAGSGTIDSSRMLTLYASGGVNDYTGLAMLHGTPTRPEGILNAEDYKAWKQDIKTTNLLYGALANVSAVQRSTAAAIGSTTNNETGINIENAIVNMNTTIANDYDARRAGEQALEQMLTIARKSGTRSAQRR